MFKKEALEYIKSKKGYVPYSSIFEIFEDTDQIPQELIEISIKEDSPKGAYLIGGIELIKQFQKLIK